MFFIRTYWRPFVFCVDIFLHHYSVLYLYRNLYFLFSCIFIVWLRSKRIYFYSTTIFVHSFSSSDHISTGSALHGWSDALLKILNELSDEDLEKIKYFMCWNEKYKIYRSLVEHKNRVQLADQTLKQWGEFQSILNTRDLVKNIPRNDDAMKELFEPYLKIIGETW